MPSSVPKIEPKADFPLRTGEDPFPGVAGVEVDGFQYFDELHFVRHARAPTTAPDAKWQVARDYKVRFDVHAGGEDWTQELVVPRGLYNDLASVPPLLWSMIGPVGPHLEASIVHDYLYMAWTDFRPLDQARREDQEFADKVFRAAMREASDLKRWRRFLIYQAVRNFGWSTFKKKSDTLASLLEVWLKDLEDEHGRD